MAPSGNQTETEKTNISLKHRKGLEERRVESIVLQESAEGIVGICAGRAIEALRSRKVEKQIGRAVKLIHEGPNGMRGRVGGN